MIIQSAFLLECKNFLFSFEICFQKCIGILYRVVLSIVNVCGGVNFPNILETINIKHKYENKSFIIDDYIYIIKNICVGKVSSDTS